MQSPYASPKTVLSTPESDLLEVTWARTLRVWWSYFWRNLVAIVAVAIVGAFVGAILGFLLGAIGLEPETIAIITAPIGMLLGAAFSIVPMWLILGKNFGEFRLVLLRS